MKRLAPLAVGGTLGLGLAGAVWWLLGDLTSPGFAPEDLDYMIRAPAVLERNAKALGFTGVVVSIAALALTTALWRHLERRPKLILTGLGVAGAYVGMASRMFTAGGIGANIGAGLVVFLGIGASVAWYAVYSWQGPRPVD